MKRPPPTRLADAYEFLRRVEHRIQYLDDQQTHLLPTRRRRPRLDRAQPGPARDGRRLRAARRSAPTREFVAAEFDALLHDGRAPAPATAAPQRCGRRRCRSTAKTFLDQLPPRAGAARAPRWRRQPRGAGAARRQQACASAAWCSARRRRRGRRALHAWQAALRFVDWIEPLLRRESYLALLVERPEVQQAAAAPARPGALADALPDAAPGRDRRTGRRRAAARPLRPPRRSRANSRSATRAGSAPARPTRSALLDTLRRAHHAEVFRTLVRDVEGHITVEQVADDLSALADAVLACTLRWAWTHLKQRHRESRSSRSSPTASSAARSSATAATSTSCSSTTTDDEPTRRPRSTAPSCAS